ncbi:exostosin [Leptolyngbya sp. NK1-12]|uniref:Exostosin n=1 Tax=Leptolyngbya sp. NK1-12 TaxID=2547451 RepID=A0AA97ASU2_9CYAN|nr:exostosin [Leptolyngbya sp. NK1-12]
MKLKFFADRQYFSERAPLIPLLYPFWGIPSQQCHQLWNATIAIPALQDFIQSASSYFEIAPLPEADFAILPNDLEFFAQEEVATRSNQLIAVSKAFSKPVIGFFSGDCSHLPVPFDIDLSFRDSLYRSTRKSNEFLSPTWTEDLVKTCFDGQMTVRQKREKPVIGFCGYAAGKSFKTHAKTMLYHLRKVVPKPKQEIPPYYTGHIIRSLALSRLSQSPLVEMNFVIRQQAGLIGGEPSQTQNYRNVFTQNMLNSDYIFCCRGSGNHSNRLYETLCCGRIPVILDTDCVFPLEFDIDWKKYCVYVKETELTVIDQKIAEFHASISPTRFIELQHECRELWKSKLSPEGFFSHLYRYFEVLESSALAV